jgi:hypothetical protein
MSCCALCAIGNAMGASCEPPLQAAERRVAGEIRPTRQVEFEHCRRSHFFIIIKNQGVTLGSPITTRVWGRKEEQLSQLNLKFKLAHVKS